MDEHHVETTGSTQPDEAGQAGDAAPAPAGADAARAPAGETDPVVALQRSAGSGGGLRLFAAALTLPWAFLYGVTGVWAVTLGARAFADGLDQVDAGYTRIVTPGELVFMGALVLAGFGVMLACGLLVIVQSRSAVAWLPLLLVATGLTAGSVWAAVRGGLHPALWVLLFFGLAYVTILALVRVVLATRAGRRGRIARR